MKKNKFLVTIKFLVIILASSTYAMESERNFKKRRVDDPIPTTSSSVDDSLPTTSSPYGMEVEKHSNSEVDPNSRLAYYKFHPDLPWDKKKYRHDYKSKFDAILKQSPENIVEFYPTEEESKFIVKTNSDIIVKGKYNFLKPVFIECNNLEIVGSIEAPKINLKARNILSWNNSDKRVLPLKEGVFLPDGRLGLANDIKLGKDVEDACVFRYVFVTDDPSKFKHRFNHEFGDGMTESIFISDYILPIVREEPGALIANEIEIQVTENYFGSGNALIGFDHVHLDAQEEIFISREFIERDFATSEHRICSQYYGPMFLPIGQNIKFSSVATRALENKKAQEGIIFYYRGMPY